MDYTNSIAYRRKRYKDERKNQTKVRQDRLKTHADGLSTINYEQNDLNYNTPGLSNNYNFSSPIMVSSMSANSGLFDSNDEPTRIRALRIKGRTQGLSQKDIDYLQRYQYMQDNQQDKDNRYILNESWKVGKKLLGLNAKNGQVAVN